jgi:hypothetical protein
VPVSSSTGLEDMHVRSTLSQFRIRSIVALIGLAIAVAACSSPSGAAPAGGASAAPAAPAGSAAPVTGGNGRY